MEVHQVGSDVFFLALIAGKGAWEMEGP